MVPSHAAVSYGGGGALKLPWIQTTDYEPSAQ